MLDENGNNAEKDSLGHLRTRLVTDEEAEGRENYRKGDARNYLDGDNEETIYGYGKTTLINDQARVYKGGSWSDRLYWVSPGTRRFKDENTSDRDLGFRCAMIRMGSSSGNDDTGGNIFSEKRGKVKRRYK